MSSQRTTSNYVSDRERGRKKGEEKARISVGNVMKEEKIE